MATRCQILWLKCTKFDFGWGSGQDPTGGAYSAPPDLVVGFKGPTSKGKEGKEREGKRRVPVVPNLPLHRLYMGTRGGLDLPSFEVFWEDSKLVMQK